MTVEHDFLSFSSVHCHDIVSYGEFCCIMLVGVCLICLWCSVCRFPPERYCSIEVYVCLVKTSLACMCVM